MPFSCLGVRKREGRAGRLTLGAIALHEPVQETSTDDSSALTTYWSFSVVLAVAFSQNDFIKQSKYFNELYGQDLFI